MIAQLAEIQINYEWIHPFELKDEETIIVFIHEALGSIGQWKKFPQTLCDELGARGIVYERQGHGKSSSFSKTRTRSYLHEYALNEFPAFIDFVLGKEQKVILVGHSDGGTITLLYAAQFPKRVEKMITMAAHVINEPETIAGIEPAVIAYQKGKLDGLKKYHGEKTEALFFAWADIWRDPTFTDWNIVNEIKNDHTSGLFIQGTEDQYGTKKQLQLIEQSISKSSILFLENCGHHPHLEQPETVISAIKKWLSY